MEIVIVEVGFFLFSFLLRKTEKGYDSIFFFFFGLRFFFSLISLLERKKKVLDVIILYNPL